MPLTAPAEGIRETSGRLSTVVCGSLALKNEAMHGGLFVAHASFSPSAAGHEAIRRVISIGVRVRSIAGVSPIHGEALPVYSHAAFTGRAKVVTTIAPDGAVFLVRPTGCPRRTMRRSRPS